MIYKRDGKLCPECNDPNCMRMIDVLTPETALVSFNAMLEAHLGRIIKNAPNN